MNTVFSFLKNYFSDTKSIRIAGIVTTLLLIGAILWLSLSKGGKQFIDTNLYGQNIELTNRVDSLKRIIQSNDSTQINIQAELESYKVLYEDEKNNVKTITKMVYKDTGSVRVEVVNVETVKIIKDSAGMISLPFKYPVNTKNFKGAIVAKEDSTMFIEIDTLPNDIMVNKFENKLGGITETVVTIENSNPILSNNHTRIDTIKYQKVNDEGLRNIEENGKQEGYKSGKKKGFWNGVKVTAGAIGLGIIYLLLK